jgi:LCCL domain
MSARDRLVVAAVIAFVAGAFVLSRVNDPGPALAVAVAPPPASSSAVVPTPAAVVPSSVAESSPSYPCGRRRVGRWQAHACESRGQIGATVVYDCPAGGPPAKVWGDLVYTDDSSVCTAAVHAGAITVDQGGAVTIRIRPGQAGYVGTERNGIRSKPWDRWAGSFEIVGSPPLVGRECLQDVAADDVWQMAPCAYRGNDGLEVAYACPSSRVLVTVWGDRVYTDDSSVCTAAVHASALSQARGGTVRITIAPGRSSYAASSRNGVTTQPWEEWGGSFEILMPPSGP